MFTYTEIAQANKDESLLPSKEIVNTIMLSALPLQDQVALLLGQVGIAKKRKNWAWLSRVAEDANKLQFHNPRWISENISRVQQPKKAASAMPAGPSRDIRLTDNPDMERLVADEGKGATAMEIDQLTSQIDEVLGTTASASAGARPKEVKKISSSPVRRSPRKPSPQKPPTETKRRPAAASSRKEHERAKDSRKESNAPRKYGHTHQSRDTRKDKPSERRHEVPHDDRRKGRHYGHREEARPGRHHKSGHGKRSHPEQHESFRSAEKKPRVETERPHRTRIDVTVCPIPGCGEIVSRTHAFSVHLPGILDDRRGFSQEVTRSRMNLLIHCASRIVGCLDVSILARYICNLGMVTQACTEISKPTKRALDSLCKEMGSQIQEEYQVETMNSPALLMHWRVFLVVLGCLDRKTRESLRDDYPAISLPLDQRPCAVDSHFHLDRIRNKLGNQAATFTDVLKAVDANIGDEVRIVGGVAVFCDPATYPSQEEVAQLASQGVGVAVGLHPKTKNVSEDSWNKFSACLQLEGVRALGEVGLDHFKIDRTLWDQQHVVLSRALDHLTPDKVLVLHNRGDGTEMLELLFHLKGVVPKEQRIHLHCFSGNASTRDRWVATFPNVHFGFTGLVADFNASQKEALRTLEPGKLLLETDAPYFSFGHQISTPALLGTTAQLVAEIRGETREDTLWVSAENARRLYQLPTP